MNIRKFVDRGDPISNIILN